MLAAPAPAGVFVSVAKVLSPLSAASLSTPAMYSVAPPAARLPITRSLPPPPLTRFCPRPLATVMMLSPRLPTMSLPYSPPAPMMLLMFSTPPKPLAS